MYLYIVCTTVTLVYLYKVLYVCNIVCMYVYVHTVYAYYVVMYGGIMVRICSYMYSVTIYVNISVCTSI